MAEFDRESMLEMYIFEMNNLIEQLEQTVVQSETGYNSEQINEIFRIMHTIKGSSAMMMFENIEKMAHAVEDLFYYLREESPTDVDYPTLSDHVLEGADFVKLELAKIQGGAVPDGDGSSLIGEIRRFLGDLKQPPGKMPPGNEATTPEPTPTPIPQIPAPKGINHFRAKVMFVDGCEMENIRAYTLIHNMGDFIDNIKHVPKDVIDDGSIEEIRKNGFVIEFTTQHDYQKIYEHLMQTVYLKDLELEDIGAQLAKPSQTAASQTDFAPETERPAEGKSAQQSPSPGSNQKTPSGSNHMISVNVGKLDILLNLMGELVIAEAMVTQNPDLDGLQLDSFYKETRQLQKIIGDLRETIMSMRMVPLSGTFFKMHRIVRDMCRQLDKDVQLDIIGENTEVDKNIIEHIADPIMHIIRNSVDHGIEMPENRIISGKASKGTVTLEAKNAGGDIWIIISDDGAGLNRDKILQKAQENGLLKKPEAEYTDKEIFQFIFLPGFSTNTQVTAFSGRGVGMDVVMNNLEVVGGSVQVDSIPGEGSTFTLKIPSTLAIQEGMTVLMAGAKYTIPIALIKRSIKVNEDVTIFSDPDGNEMINLRGEMYNILRLYEFFDVEGAVTDINEGILLMVENSDQTICVMVDELIGQQQAVVKPMPKYFRKARGISGCTLLGNGDISLIIDVAGLFDN